MGSAGSTRVRVRVRVRARVTSARASARARAARARTASEQPDAAASITAGHSSAAGPVAPLLRKGVGARVEELHERVVAPQALGVLQ